jgi:drug/metabolite transporter (DMT)-like permease
MEFVAKTERLLREWGPIVGPGVIWGSSYLFIAEGLTAMRPAGITFVRTLIGFIVLSLIPGSRKPIESEDRWRVGLLGLIWLAFPMSMFPFAEQHVSSALTGLLNGATPLFVAIVATGQARKWPNPHVSLALGVGLIGAGMIAAPSIGGGGNKAWAVGLILVALCSYGFAINLSRPLQQRNGALPVLWRAVGIAALLTAPTGLPALLDAKWNLRAVLSMVALGALGTGIANVLVANAAGRSSATRASAMGFIIPVVSLGLGLLVLGEEVELLAVAGGAVCLGGAWLLATAPKRSLAGVASQQ